MASDRQQENQRLLAMIRTIHKESRQNYGSPKVYRQLRRQGEACNHKRVKRLMRENLRLARLKLLVASIAEHQSP